MSDGRDGLFDRPLSRRAVLTRVAGVAVAALAVGSLPACTAAESTTTAGSGSSSSGVLLDEAFDGDALDTTVWNTSHWWGPDGSTIASNDELEWYQPGQVTVADGALQLTAERREVKGSDGSTYDYVSGMVTTGPRADGESSKLAFTYGTVEARVKLPEGKGLWPAVWLLPASQKSLPEIDLLEAIGQDLDHALLHLHPADSSRAVLAKTVAMPEGATFADGWRTVHLAWSSGLLVYSIDGKEVWRVSGSDVPSEPMYVVMNLAVGGTYPGTPSSSTVFPATFSIDYVRITGSAAG